jgi:site-specific recombinase XerD
MEKLTVSEAINRYLVVLQDSRSANTVMSYRKGLNYFTHVLAENNVQADVFLVEQLKEEALTWLLSATQKRAIATEQLYTHTVLGFFEFVVAENLSDINLSRLALISKQKSRRTKLSQPKLTIHNIERLLDYISNIDKLLIGTENVALDIIRLMRDRAFLLTLADTGLRVHEACALRRGDIDWNEGRAVIIGKGDKQAVVRFSTRSLQALRDYLSQRASLDGGSGKPLSSLPLFARHDKGAGKKIKPITATTGRNIVDERVKQALGDSAGDNITPHSFRHYFVTTVLRGSGNLKLAQELARHANIQVTQRYAHLSDDELDKGYHDIFEKK